MLKISSGFLEETNGFQETDQLLQEKFTVGLKEKEFEFHKDSRHHQM